jgi:PEP-CTERM motif
MQKYLEGSIDKISLKFLHPSPVGIRWKGMGQTRSHFTMKHTHTLRSPRGHPIIRCLLLGLASAISCQAAVTVISSFTVDPNTNLYTYSYSVENSGPQDLALVTLPSGAASNIFGVFSPIGFSQTYDPVFGFISFFEDSDLLTDQSFAVGSIITPFQFTSALAPGSVTYTAYDIAGDEFTGTAVAPVPEPSALLLAGLSILSASAFRRRSSL